jgi:hypothetical protein
VVIASYSVYDIELVVVVVIVVDAQLSTIVKVNEVKGVYYKGNPEIYPVT